MRRLVQAVVVAALCSAGCGVISGLVTDERAQVEQTYRRFHQAVVGGDMKTAVALVSAERAAEFNGPTASEQFELAGGLMPPQISITRIDVSGSEATIHAAGRVEGATATGLIKMRKESGAWKIGHESWNVSMQLAGNERATPRQDVMRPDAGEYAKLRGQWKGTAAGASDEWTFSFGDAYAVVVSDGVRSYEGLAAFHPELGAERDGTIRVRPGSGVIDIDVVQGSEQDYNGKTSLGQYYFTSPTELQLCGSRPGAMVRVQSYDTSTADVRCFKLAKVSDDPLPSTLAAEAPAAAPAPATPSAPPVRAAALDKGDPGVTGEAVLQLDGAPARYSLRTGFFYDTRFKDPQRATIQFQPEESSNLTAGLLVTVNATRAGSHTTDGNATQIQWIADGGQVFPPKSTCVVRVTSPYDGNASGTFKGEIDRCVVHSAGIDRTLSSVRFVMIGAPSR